MSVPKRVTESNPQNSTVLKIAPILGVNVSMVTMESAVDKVTEWIGKKENRYVCVADVHSVMRGHQEAAHRQVMNKADMVAPDGTPLVWVNRLRGIKNISRVAGPDLLPAVCSRSVEHQWRHFFYGGAEGVADDLARKLQNQFKGLQIAGTDCPPFRELSPEEDEKIIAHINAARPDIIWVGLGCPKQERWMAEHVEKIEGAVLIGVGAAFDFHTDQIKRAPAFMQRFGIEWLHRLFSEPRRLWRRYLILAPCFLTLVIRETFSMPMWRR